jgi:hypothetical protein
MSLILQPKTIPGQELESHELSFTDHLAAKRRRQQYTHGGFKHDISTTIMYFSQFACVITNFVDDFSRDRVKYQ